MIARLRSVPTWTQQVNIYSTCLYFLEEKCRILFSKLRRREKQQGKLLWKIQHLELIPVTAITSFSRASLVSPLFVVPIHCAALGFRCIFFWCSERWSLSLTGCKLLKTQYTQDFSTSFPRCLEVQDCTESQENRYITSLFGLVETGSTFFTEVCHSPLVAIFLCRGSKPRGTRGFGRIISEHKSCCYKKTRLFFSKELDRFSSPCRPLWQKSLWLQRWDLLKKNSGMGWVSKNVKKW